MVGVLSQLSVAVGLAGAGAASHCTVVSLGQPASTGATVSCTVMTCVQLERSEERRVGEEGRARWSPYHLQKPLLVLVLVSLRVMVGVLSQLSVAVGLAGGGRA